MIQTANHLKKSYFNWNKDNITDDVIFKNLAELSGGELKMDENAALSSYQELRGKDAGGLWPSVSATACRDLRMSSRSAMIFPWWICGALVVD